MELKPLPTNLTALRMKWRMRRLLRLLRLALLIVLDLCVAGYVYLLIVYPDLTRQGLVAIKHLINK